MVSREDEQSLDDRIRELEKVTSGLTVKAGVWGSIAGLIPILIWLTYHAVSGK